MSIDVSLMQESSIPGGMGGRIVPIRSSERARELARRRWDAKGRAIREGIAAAAASLPDFVKVGKVEGASPLEVIRAISEQHALHSYAAGETGSAASFKLILEHGFPKPDKAEVDSTQVPPDEEMQQLIALFKRAKKINPELDRIANEVLHGNE